MFPWESAFSGVECTEDKYPFGKQEQHISSDIGLAIWWYYLMGRDPAFLQKAYPVLAGIADFWVSRYGGELPAL
jgi:trehalose/maltose hydrolase-like predicted phosphorylase